MFEALRSRLSDDYPSARKLEGRLTARIKTLLLTMLPNVNSLSSLYYRRFVLSGRESSLFLLLHADSRVFWYSPCVS